MTGMRDGIRTGEFNCEVGSTISGTMALLGVTTGSMTTGIIGTFGTAAGQVSSTECANIINGSPAVTTGVTVQGGGGTLGAGSSVAVTFGTAFKAAPNVVVSLADNIDSGNIRASGISTTGFTAYGAGAIASKVFSWMAIGSL